MLSKMSFNKTKQLYQRNNNIKIKKNTMAELYVNCNNKASLINFKSIDHNIHVL